MKLRTQIVAGFVVLSVLPLSAIVLYGYYSSEKGFRRAVAQPPRLKVNMAALIAPPCGTPL